jgi:hypothetical protein
LFLSESIKCMFVAKLIWSGFSAYGPNILCVRISAYESQYHRRDTLLIVILFVMVTHTKIRHILGMPTLY